MVHKSLLSPLIAAVYGALAGMLGAATLWLMTTVSRLVWSVSDANWYVPLAVVCGGVPIAPIRRVTAYTPAGDGRDLLCAVLPALLGAGATFVWSRPRITLALARLGGPQWSSTSGQRCVCAAGRWGWGCSSHWALTLCLSSGWRSDESFPLVFADAAVSLTTVIWLPGS